MSIKDDLYRQIGEENTRIRDSYRFICETAKHIATEYGINYEITTEIKERTKKDYYTDCSLFNIFTGCNSQKTLFYQETYVINNELWDDRSVYGTFNFGSYKYKFMISLIHYQYEDGKEIINYILENCVHRLLNSK